MAIEVEAINVDEIGKKYTQVISTNIGNMSGLPGRKNEKYDTGVLAAAITEQIKDGKWAKALLTVTGITATPDTLFVCFTVGRRAPNRGIKCAFLISAWKESVSVLADPQTLNERDLNRLQDLLEDARRLWGGNSEVRRRDRQTDDFGVEDFLDSVVEANYRK